MRATTSTKTTLLALAGLGASGFASAGSPPLEASVRAGGGLGALAVRADLDARRLYVRTCPGRAPGPCAADTSSPAVPIGLEPGQAGEQVRFTEIDIGEGRRILRVTVPRKGRSDVAWEALLAAGQAEPLFAGLTGWTAGDEGERTGTVIQVVPREGSPSSFVVLGRAREDLRLCGQPATALEPRALDAKSLAWRGATVQRLPREQREGARRLTAVAKGGPADPALGRLLVARGASTEASGDAVVDGDPTTTWSEERPGDGHGEFVVLRATPDVPLQRLALTVAPPGPKAATRDDRAAPRTFFLVTDSQTFAVSMPEDAWTHPGAAYEVPLPEPVRASCVALVLDEAYAGSNKAPVVTVAELTGYSEFDTPGATLDAVAAGLKGGGRRGLAAAGVLQRAGGAADAVARVYADLDARGRALAMDAIATEPCERIGALLARGAADADREVSRKGGSKLQRCGKAAIPGLVEVVKSDPTARRVAAHALAALAPDVALDALAPVLGEGSAEARASTRAAFATAARVAPKEKLAALLREPSRSEGARLELLRATTERLADVPAEANAAMDALAPLAPPGRPDFRTRYLLVPPTAALAAAGDGRALSRLREALARDADWPVRAYAAEHAGAIPSARADLSAATRDPSPRVRAAALRALAGGADEGARDVAAARLKEDRWTFVRGAAVAALRSAPAARDVDAALAEALTDAAPSVRAAALDALAAHRATAHVDPVRARFVDESEEGEVRAAAARGLGALCDRRALDRLTVAALALGTPGASEQELQVGVASLEALAAVHPADLRERLASLLDKRQPPHVRQSAERALSARAACP